MGRPFRLVAATGLVAILMLSMTSASAATNPVSPLRVCGYGYRIVDKVAASTYLTVYLLRNAINGDKCVVALKGDTTMGRNHAMDVHLEVKNGAYRRMTGVQTYYLGPVRLPAAGKCVMWGGIVSVSGRWFGGERLNWGNCS